MLIRIVLIVACALMVMMTPAQAHSEVLEVESVDGRTLEVFVDRPEGPTPVPALLVIDGSGCLGARRPGFIELMSPFQFKTRAFAKIVVGKTGVPPEKSRPGDCSDAFMKSYSMHTRVLDHLRVLQALRQTKNWWNGELMIFGWSDGGEIAARVFAFTPDAKRLAFGGVGGGLTMRQHFEDLWVCPEGQIPSRTDCLADLNATFDEIETNPTWTKTWSGESNSYQAWASRLNTRLTPLLKGETRPVLMIHGALDFDAAPVQSAQKLASELRTFGNMSFEYWQVDQMKHDIWSLDPETALALEKAAFNWLMEQPITLPNVVRKP